MNVFISKQEIGISDENHAALFSSGSLAAAHDQRGLMRQDATPPMATSFDPNPYITEGGSWGIRIINHSINNKNREVAWMTAYGFQATKDAEKSIMEMYSVEPPARFASAQDAEAFLFELFGGKAARARGKNHDLDEIEPLHYCRRIDTPCCMRGLESEQWAWVPMKSYKIRILP